ncbi:nucleoside phosphorylase [Microvirga sp. TS319]|uniref:phosphorylase family protein n=1 Tax=Microvirga sp. TS319 TaxID=3241165 RepID=UPI00351AAA56
MIAGPDLVTICSGGSPERLRHKLSRHTPAYRAVVSFGIAGGLDPSLSPGDVVLAQGIVNGKVRWLSHPGLTQDWVQRLSVRGQNVVEAEIAGVEDTVRTPVAKAALRSATGAAAVDMESHVAAEFAAVCGVPFAAIRVICDAANHSLPPFVGDALDADGLLDWQYILRGVMRQPIQIALLARLALASSAALAGLRHCRPLLGPNLEVGNLAQPFSDIS